MARRRLALPPLAHRTLVTSSREPPAASHQPPAANRTAWCLARQQVQQQVPTVLRQFSCWAIQELLTRKGPHSRGGDVISTLSMAAEPVGSALSPLIDRWGLHSRCRRGERVCDYTYGNDADLGTLTCTEMSQQAINIVVSAMSIDGKVGQRLRIVRVRLEMVTL